MIIKAMPYRRRKLIELTPAEALKTAYHANQSRTGYYPWLGNPLVNYNAVSHGKRKDIPTVSNRRVKSWLIPKHAKKIFSINKAMPYRSRRQYKRTRPIRARRRRLRAIPTGIPQSKLVKFKLTASSQSIAIGAGGALSGYSFKVNSFNDPTGSMTAQLPRYLDQYAALYQKYIILGAKVQVRFVRVSGTGAQICGLHLDESNTMLTDHDDYREQFRTKTRMLTDQHNYATITINYSGKKFWKVKDLKDDSEQEGALSLTPGDPTDIAYVHAFIQDLNKTDAYTYEMQLTMEFITLLTNPIAATRSSL